MTYFERMTALGLSVGWGTLLIGRVGPGKFTSLLSVDDVRSFVRGKIADDKVTDSDAVAIAIASDDEGELIDQRLAALAQAGHFDRRTELRKWRAVLLADELERLPASPLKGLIALTEFWEKFDYPTESPHSVQGRDDTLPPAAYYEASRFDTAKVAHRAWLGREVAEIQAIQENQQPA